MKVEQAGAYDPKKLTLDGIVYFYEPGSELMSTVDGYPVPDDVRRRVLKSLRDHYERIAAADVAARGRAAYPETP